MSEAMPPFSIVIPLYNKEATVERAIRSALNQTVQDFEIIVVNDGSTDNSVKVVEAIGAPRIRLIHQENQGVSAARNRGIAEAQHELIAFLDADDEWFNDYLETIIRLKVNFPSCRLYATNYIYCRPSNYSRNTVIRGLPTNFKEGVLKDYFSVSTRSDPPLWSSAVSVAKKAITKVGGFPLGITTGEDLLTWARLFLNYEIAYCIEPKVYNWEPTRISDRPGREPRFPDIVGTELNRLLSEANASKIKGLINYVAHWHKMRAVTFLRLNKSKQALSEIHKAVDFAGMNSKLFLLATLAYLPGNLPEIVFRFLTRIKDQYRGVRQH